VAPRVSPSERIRDEIAELIAGATTGSLLDQFEQVARLAVRLVMQSALEAEVTEFLGRDRYARGERERAGSRNGYTPMSVKTTAGRVTLARPKLRGTTQAFASRLLGKGVTRTNALESLVIAGFVRGLSVRDVEASLADALGPQATVSKSTVSRICEQIKDEFDAWKTRSLADLELDYLFADGSFFRMHPGAPAEPVLVAWGLTTTGKPVLLGLEPGNAESTDAWASFFGGLKARGLHDPLLVVSDGGGDQRGGGGVVELAGQAAGDPGGARRQNLNCPGFDGGLTPSCLPCDGASTKPSGNQRVKPTRLRRAAGCGAGSTGRPSGSRGQAWR
jgi:putative transposase